MSPHYKNSSYWYDQSISLVPYFISHDIRNTASDSPVLSETLNCYTNLNLLFWFLLFSLGVGVQVNIIKMGTSFIKILH